MKKQKKSIWNAYKLSLSRAVRTWLDLAILSVTVWLTISLLAFLFGFLAIIIGG